MWIELLHIRRFDQKVSVEPGQGPNGDCWEWQAGKNKDGYGKFKLYGHTHTASRVSWMIYYGEIPQKGIIAHRCDNRACVKISHLFLTDNAGNSKDMKAKERQARGEKNPKSKLSTSEIESIP